MTYGKRIPKDNGYMGDLRRGASIGRPERSNPDPNASHKFSLRRIRINREGYDDGGAYWGGGLPLYWAANYDGTIECFFRAATRNAAKAHIRNKYLDAVFYH